MTSDVDRRFPLSNPGPKFETKRELVGLFKQGPLETNREFAERVAKAFQEHHAKRQAKQRAKLPPKSKSE
jgi:hypothetical protein